ncbi:MAG: DUF2087 domain-containing protein [Acidimicrobiia bacterium]
MALTPTDFLRIVLDPHRLAVLGLAALGPLDVEKAAHQLRMTVGQVRRAVSRLVEAGLLDQELALDRAALRAVAEALPGNEPVAGSVLDGPWSSEERQLLGRYFVGSRLTEVPAQPQRRRVVLERLAHEFEPGVRYDEKEVNMILLTFHPDYAALRRYLIDEGFLTRADGSYWRSGGRVEV